MDVHDWASAWLVLVAVLSAARAGMSRNESRAGWLDRLVLYHKNRFIEEIKQLAPINIQVSIEKAPIGYVDSPSWDYASVTRLLALIGASETARPVRSALRRALRGNETVLSRRFMSRQKSYQFFPSKAKMYLSNMYYDANSDADYMSEEEAPWGALPLTEHAVVQVRNPVEARLPSGRISVDLLKEILEARAVAARQMPTIKTTSGWTWTTSEPIANTSSAVPHINTTEASSAPTTEAANDTTEVDSIPPPGQDSGGTGLNPNTSGTLSTSL